MTDLTSLKTRVRLLLEDSDGKRFSDTLLEAAMRLALDEIDERLPLVSSADFTASSTSRDQPLTGLSGCRYLINITWPAAGDSSRELEPETQFTYCLKDGAPILHFTGSEYPQAGDAITVRYAAGHAIAGFDGALTTTLPGTCESALVNGTAGHACHLRAGSLVERPGTKNEETSRLVEIGRLWLNNFQHTLNGLKTLQDFGFPPGFALDQWDRAAR